MAQQCEQPEEPFLVERANGVKHPSETYARAFLGLVRAGEALDRSLDLELKARHGLSLRAFEVLLHLAAFSPSGSLRMSQLTAQAPLSQSRVSRLVAELEARGLATRSAFAGDNRGVLVSITEGGLDALRAAQDTHYTGLYERLFAHLTWTDVTTLARVTATITAETDPADPTRP
jgi:DNA-binding MarR family transcriptional regulator